MAAMRFIAVAILLAILSTRDVSAQINPLDMRSGIGSGTGPGTVGLFTVPAGRTFVLTDFNWTCYPFNVNGVGSVITVNGGLGTRWLWWSFDNSAVTPGTDHENPVGAHWTTGLVFNAGEQVTATAGAQAMPFNVTWTASWSGYLTPGSTSNVTEPGGRMGLDLAPAPNPYGDRVHIDFQLPGSESVTLAIFDVLGHKIRTLVSGELPAGAYSIPWDGNNENGRAVGDGLYFARLVTPQGTEVRKVTRRR